MRTIDQPLAPPVTCSVCGFELRGDPDDEPDHPTGPVCGNCWRARADDELLWAIQASGSDDDLW
ncbi:MAG: hypothetical protein U0667_11475 [Chloroflexota bacterium]|jgi:hypothetical protein